MLVSLLTFLSENKVIITGATLCVGEVIVIITNLYRKNKIETKAKAIDTIIKKNRENPEWPPWLAKTNLQKILWAANPLNLFKN